MDNAWTLFLSFGVKLVIALGAALIVLKFFSMKNQLKQMTPLDVVLNFVLSAIISSFILNDNFTILEFLGIMVIYGAMMYLIGWFTFSSKIGRRIFVGNPRVIIRDGKCDIDMMKKLKISASDVAAVLRKQHIRSISDVNMAQIEPSGDLTVVRRGHENYSLVLIDNGRVMDAALARLKKTPTWLKKQLRTHGIHDAADVFIAQWTPRGLDIVTMN